MTSPSNASKKRLLFVLLMTVLAIFFLTIRLGFIQIVKGEELKKGALEQWTKGIYINAKRGTIFDRNGKKLAISISSHTVWASPADIKDPVNTAKKVAEVLNLDESEVYEKLIKDTNVIKIKQWISLSETKELRNLNLPGIEIVDDNKRFYPYGEFASHILGFTDIDNNGLYGIEKTFDKYLSGTQGMWVKTEDARGVEMPYGGEKIYDPEDGLNVVLTLDETIQHFAEKYAKKALIDTKAKNVSIIVMEPHTGDVLAMTNMPQYDPNNPREPLDEETKKEWEKLPQEELQKKWYDMWRTFSINDSYEPGSTFKVIVAAAALEENAVQLDTPFYCDGFVTDIPGAVLKCARWYNPHGHQTFEEGLYNSCNVVFVDVGRRLGKENLYKYIKAFGFGEKTGIELTGEQAGIIPVSTDVIKEVNLATMSYGHGIAVTPIQLITAVSAIANGGKLMIPRLVSKLVDNEGNVVKTYEPEVKRQVISESTAKTILKLMEGVVSEGTGSNAYVPGYRVAGKTGTAQKIVDGRYAPGKYIGSFIAIAPADDPKIAILVIVDEPVGIYYGGSVAAPVAGKLIEETLNYMEVEKKFTEEEKKKFENTEIVPDVRNLTIGEAGRTLTQLGFRYTTESNNIEENSVVIEQFPLAGSKVTKGSIIDLYLDSGYKSENMVIVPDLSGKTKADVVNILDGLGLTYEFEGEGIAVDQTPKPGAEISIDTKVKVVFKNTNDN